MRWGWLYAVSALLAGCAASKTIPLYDVSAVAASEVVKVVLPEALEVARLNGAEVPGAQGMFSRGDKTLELAPGVYSLLVYYRELWIDGDAHEVFRSDPLLLKLNAQPGHRYRLRYPKLQRFDEARAFSASPKIWVEDLATGQRTEAQASGLAHVTGLLPSVRGDALVKASPQGDEALNIASDSAGALPPDGLAAVQNSWRQASPAQRAAFLEWISSPESMSPN